VRLDDIEGSAEFVPTLTTVAQPMSSLGRVAARYLLDVLAQGNPPSCCITSCPPNWWCAPQLARRIKNRKSQRGGAPSPDGYENLASSRGQFKLPVE